MGLALLRADGYVADEKRERLREMAEEQGRPASRVLEDLILTKR